MLDCRGASGISWPSRKQWEGLLLTWHNEIEKFKPVIIQHVSNSYTNVHVYIESTDLYSSLSLVAAFQSQWFSAVDFDISFISSSSMPLSQTNIIKEEEKFLTISNIKNVSKKKK